MSSFHAIWTVSRALQQILWEAFDADNVLRGIVGSAAAMVLSNPTDVQRDPANRLSLWLLVVIHASDARVHYRLNAARKDEIAAMLAP